MCFSIIKSLLGLLPLTVASLVLAERPAQAILIYYVYDNAAGNAVVRAKGELNLPSATLSYDCSTYPNGLFAYGTGPTTFLACTGSNQPANAKLYAMSEIFNVYSPTGLGNSFIASSASGLSTSLFFDISDPASPSFGVDPSYVSNSPIDSISVFTGISAASLGFATPGIIGMWNVGIGDNIVLAAGAPPSTPTPGPLPLFGAAAAFGYSRRLRRRVNQASSTAPLSGTISA